MTLSIRPVTVAVLAALTLTGCSLGKKPPPFFLNVTPVREAAAGTGASGTADTALAILDLQAPQKINVTRVPVTTGDSSLAYLKDAEWVEKPARLFQRLLADTVRAKGTRLLVSGTDLEFTAASKLSGTLSAMDYDAASGTAVVRFDGVLISGDSQVTTRRFEARVPGVAADPAAVGAALNTAANQVASEVADWVG
ncbi:ABC-type transport auxiliary lipoprotein family protein [Tsuneonella sp. HG222]